MKELSIFEHSEFGEIRTTEDENGNILFCATDVARVLGYSNPQKAIRDHCRGVIKRSGVSITKNQHGTVSKQKSEMNFITEPNIYRLIVSSKLPSAIKFESWVFDEVLPSIRKRGMYCLDKLVADPEFLTALAEELKNRQRIKK